jgi:protein phosphatase
MRSAVGLVRAHNEDAAHIDSGYRFFVVADGMGGENAGEIASSLAVDAVRASLEPAGDILRRIEDSDDPVDHLVIRMLLERAMRAANGAVVEHSRRDPDTHGMGTTLDVVLILGDEAFVAHVGDSRTYLVRDGAATLQTRDHTVAQVMQRAGTLSPEEAEVSPLRSVLSNAIGCAAELAIDHIYLRLRPGDRLLVCTDGLYDYFDGDELARWLTCTSGDAALAGLIEQACARGGRDNLTGIVVEVGDIAAAPDDDLDDVITTPVAVPDPPGHRGPLAGVADRTVSAFVDEELREESQPYPYPAP